LTSNEIARVHDLSYQERNGKVDIASSLLSKCNHIEATRYSDHVTTDQQDCMIHFATQPPSKNHERNRDNNFQDSNFRKEFFRFRILMNNTSAFNIGRINTIIMSVII